MPFSAEELDALAQARRTQAAQLQATGSGATIDAASAALRHDAVRLANHADARRILTALEHACDNEAYQHRLLMQQLADETNQAMTKAPPQARPAILAEGERLQQQEVTRYTAAVNELSQQAQGRVQAMAAGIKGPAPAAPGDLDTKPVQPKADDRADKESDRTKDALKAGELDTQPPTTSAGGSGTASSPMMPPLPMTPPTSSPLSSGGGMGSGLSGLAAMPSSSLSSGVSPSMSAPSSLPLGVAPLSGLQAVSPTTATTASGPQSAPLLGAPQMFAQAAGSASSAASSVPPVPTAVAGGTPSSVPPAVSSPPPAAAATASAPAVVPAAAGPAQVFPPMATSVSTGQAAPMPMMMAPAPGMGAPAALPSAVSAAPPAAPATIPVSGAAPAGSGAGLVPVPTTVAAAVRSAPTDSAELALAKSVISKLQVDALGSASLIEWAVGVFKAIDSPTTDIVVTSNQGISYVPKGVFVPRTARLMATDPLVDEAFRTQYFSPDPALAMAHYAELRHGARLVALAVTAQSSTGVSVDLLRARIGAEVAVVPLSRLDGPPPPPSQLDGMHLHRLEALHPGIYGQLVKLAAAGHGKAIENQILVCLREQMIDAIQGSPVTCPAPLRQVWTLLGPAGGEISADMWQDYRLAASMQAVLVGRKADDTLYHWQWLMARTMGLVGGWGEQPLPLADMLYEAVVAHPNPGLIDQVENSLYEIERS